MARGPAPRSSSQKSDRSVERIRKRKRKLIIALLVIVLLPVVLLLVVRLLILSDGRIRSMAESTLSESLGREVTVGDLDLSILSSLEIRDVKVKDKPEYGGEMMTLGTVRVAYKPFSFLGDEIVIPEILVDGASLHVVKTADGEMNVTDLPAAPAEEPEPAAEVPEEPAGIPAFTVGRIVVKNVNLEYEDLAAGQRTALQGFGIEGKASAADNVMTLDLAGELNRMVVEMKPDPARETPPLSVNLAAKFDAGKNTFELTKAELSSDGLDVGLGAKASLDPEMMAIEASGTVSIDLAGRFASALSGIKDQSGTIGVTLETSGTLPEILSQVSVKGKDLAFPVDTGEPQPSTFRITSVTAEETVKGNLEKTLALTGGFALHDLGITGKKQQVGEISLVYDAEANLADQSASLTKMKLLGPGLALDMSGEVGAPADGRRRITLDGKLQMDLAQAVEPLAPTLRDCEGTIALSLSGSGTSLAPIIDLGLFTSPLTFTKTDTGTTYNITGLMGSLESSLSEDKAQVPVTGDLKIAQVTMTSSDGKTRTFQDLSVTEDLLLSQAGPSLLVRSIDVALPGLTAKAQGSIDAGKEPPLVDLSAEGGLDFAGLTAMTRGVMGLTEKECNGSGVASFSISLASDEKSMTAGIKAQAERIELTWSPEEEEAGEVAEETEKPAGEGGKTPEALDLEGINMNMSATVNTLVLNGVAIRNARFEMKSEGNQVTINPISGDMAGGTLKLALSANTGIPGWDYKVSGGLDHAGLSALLALADPEKADMADGSLTMQLNLAGQGLDIESMAETLQGSGDIAMSTFEVNPKNQIAKVAADVGQVVSTLQSSDGASALEQSISGTGSGNPIRFDAFQTAFTISNGAIRPEGGVNLSTKWITANFLGAVGIDGSFRDASLTFPLSERVAELVGMDRLTADLAGSFADPKVTLNVDLKEMLKSAAAGEAKKEITDRVEDLVNKEVGGEAGKAVGDMLKGLWGGKKKEE